MWEKSDVDAIYERSENAIFSILDQFCEPKPFVLEAAAQLRERGIKIGSTTGYTDEMMHIVVPAAEKLGYTPDAWFTPNSVNNMGRPYPFMVFRNLEALGVSGVRAAIKVGDTIADIKEGKNAGMISVGVIEGSSVMGYTQEEYEALSAEQKVQECQRARAVYEACGADYVIGNLSGLCCLIDEIEQNG